MSVLVIGYGNPGRRDDGLGPRLAAELEALALPHVSIEADYQLQVEHAHALAAHELVLFADAAVAGPAPLTLTPLAPAPGRPGFSTHALTPADVLGLARDLFGARPAAWVLALRGYEFDEFGEGLSPGAARNLAAAAALLGRILTAGGPDQIRIELERARDAQAARCEDMPCPMPSP